VSDLKDLAAENTKKIRENFPDNDLAIQQVLCLAEEAGEFVGAYRRWAGMARRTGPWGDVKAELADVVITAYVAANVLGIDLDAAWREKAAVVMSRGWRDAPAGTEVSR
jgi:NTP pyrophosphatase (non-canonical NTP hydrolase)